jgi:hypothetical protein
VQSNFALSAVRMIFYQAFSIHSHSLEKVKRSQNNLLFKALELYVVALSTLYNQFESNIWILTELLIFQLKQFFFLNFTVGDIILQIIHFNVVMVETVALQLVM